jgi:hypothetical protein
VDRLFRLLTFLLILSMPAFARAESSQFGTGLAFGEISESGLTELSGIAASRNNPGVLWVHNDRARDHVYAVSTNGQFLARWSFGDEIADFEDIAMGPGPSPELAYLYCGDIGDNSATRTSIRVYRAAEPAVYQYQAAEPVTAKFPAVEKFTLLYPDESQNAEAILIDPLTGDLYIATKASGRSRLYRAEQGQLQDGATATLTFVMQLDFDVVSGGDISSDGREIVLRQEEFALLWKRALGQSVPEALRADPFPVPVIGTPLEPNGEAIGFAPDGSGYFTVSEGLFPVIYFFPRTSPPLTRPLRTLVERGGTWRYRDDGSDQGTAWRSPDFNDLSWAGGAAQFGYGDSDEQTVIRYGSNKDAKHVTTYFRKEFEVARPGEFDALQIRVLFDDGIAVYLNGVEISAPEPGAGSAVFITGLVGGRRAREPVADVCPHECTANGRQHFGR